MGKFSAYRSSLRLGRLGLFTMLEGLAAGCSFSITEVTRGEIERELIERVESQGR